MPRAEQRPCGHVAFSGRAKRRVVMRSVIYIVGLVVVVAVVLSLLGIV